MKALRGLNGLIRDAMAKASRRAFVVGWRLALV
jgi:hypothetical protein